MRKEPGNYFESRVGFYDETVAFFFFIFARVMMMLVGLLILSAVVSCMVEGGDWEVGVARGFLDWCRVRAVVGLWKIQGYWRVHQLPLSKSCLLHPRPFPK